MDNDLFAVFIHCTVVLDETLVKCVLIRILYISSQCNCTDNGCVR